jgi:hypothetical protein
MPLPVSVMSSQGKRKPEANDSEILWKFSRLGSFDLSPDGSTVIYTATDIDMKTETGEPIYSGYLHQAVIRPDHHRRGQFSRWFSNGQSIAFVSGGRLMT